MRMTLVSILIVVAASQAAADLVVIGRGLGPPGGASPYATC
jgi:hypothetical protein